MQAHIITIGDELLIGQVIDSNSAFIAEQLTGIGLSVRRITTVSDDRPSLLSAFEDIAPEDTVTIMTGGLGPTNDDITKKILCEYLGDELVFHQPSWERIQQIMRKYGREATDAQRVQCYLPSGCTLLHNAQGTAPGMWFELPDGRHIISLPGVPYEMKYLMTAEVLPRIQQKIPIEAYVQRTILTAGRGESDIAEQLISLEEDLPANVKLAYLPGFRQVRLRLSARGAEREELETQINGYVEQVKAMLPNIIFGYDQQSLAESVGSLLRQKGLRMATAESCTGGQIAAEVVAVPGASDYMAGGIIAYSNTLKNNLLFVEQETIAKRGAVSQEVVEAMLQGALKQTQADVGIAVTGIAGPSGGTVDKPVGTVWISVGNQHSQFSQKHTFSNDRSINIRRTSAVALNMLRRFISKHYS